MKRFWIMLMLTLILPDSGFTGTAVDYLIMQDIGQYKFMGKGGGQGSGIVSATGHFSEDHVDESYGGMYFHESNEIGVNVEVTQHAGADSDRWLLHEVDREYRKYYGMPDSSYFVRNVNGNTILAFGAGGWDYRWLSGNKVIRIEYHDAQLTKPEPLEIIQAYLTKHPSTLPAITLNELYSASNKTKWIKDEMDRRLWLCDKWVEQQQAGKVDIDTLFKEMHDHMKVFLNYKEKYYGIASTDEKNIIYSYMQAKDETGMKNKLAEYKTWWAENKDKGISL